MTGNMITGGGVSIGDTKTGGDASIGITYIGAAMHVGGGLLIENKTIRWDLNSSRQGQGRQVKP